MTVDLVPSTDLVPSLPSRIVTVNVTDAQEGEWAADQSVQFRLVGDVHVPADRHIVLGHKGVRLPLPEGRGQVRLPIWTATTGEWAVEVKPSWTPHPYYIRVPAGSGSIDLSAINPLQEVPMHVREWLLTNASVSVVEGADWGASVSVAGGNAHFIITVPPKATVDTVVPTTRGALAAGADLDTYRNASQAGAWGIPSTGIINAPTLTAGGVLTVEHGGQPWAITQTIRTQYEQWYRESLSATQWGPWLKIATHSDLVHYASVSSVEQLQRVRQLPNPTNLDDFTGGPNSLNNGLWKGAAAWGTSGFPPVLDGGPAYLLNLRYTNDSGTQIWMAGVAGTYRRHQSGGTWTAWQRTDVSEGGGGGGGETGFAGAMARTGLEITGQDTTLVDERAYLQSLGEHALAEYVEIGESVTGRPLAGLRIGRPENTDAVLLIGGQHGNEPGPREGLLTYAREVLLTHTLALRYFTILIIPTLNPDGIVASRRNNENNVNLNRDWGPFTQPETQAVRDWIADYNVLSCLDAHNGGSWYHPSIIEADTDQAAPEILERSRRLYDDMWDLYLSEGHEPDRYPPLDEITSCYQYMASQRVASVLLEVPALRRPETDPLLIPPMGWQAQMTHLAARATVETTLRERDAFKAIKAGSSYTPPARNLDTLAGLMRRVAELEA